MDTAAGALAAARYVTLRLVLLIALVGVVALLVSTTVLPAVYAADAAVDSVEQELFDHPPLPDEIPTAPEVTRLLDADGELIAEIHGEVEREPVPLEEISDWMIAAVVATEDAEFFEHDGVNHDSIVRAGVRNVQARGVAEGASTITQQLVTMAFLDPEITMERKLREIVWAVELEERLTKSEILEAYLNRVYLGAGVYGVGAAAEHYFSRPAAELGPAQAALLAGAIRAPTANNPVDNPEAAAQRRDIVLRQMVATDALDQETADEVIGTEVALDLQDEAPGQPFWEDLVKRVVYDPSVDLQPGLQEAVAESVDARVDALFEGGLRITTTLDRDMHAQASATLRDHVNDPVEDPMGALITVDHASGAVRAMALGPKEFGPCADDEGPCTTTQVNPAVPGIGGSGRQSGSAFKPFVAATALEQGEDIDLEYDTPSGEEIENCGWDDEWEPENFDLSDHGQIDMTEAVRTSNNVYFAKLARDTGVRSIVETARAHGLVHSPNLDDFGEQDCSIGLGSAEIFPWEMAAGYGTWANDGRSCEPFIVDTITDRDGEVLYEHEPDCSRATDAATAATVRELLAGPVGPGGTASVVGTRVPDALGKTGTTDDYRDAWFVGSTGDHTTAAWVGYEHPEQHPDGMTNVTIGGQFHARVTGGSLPAPMWVDYVSQVAR